MKKQLRKLVGLALALVLALCLTPAAWAATSDTVTVNGVDVQYKVGSSNSFLGTDPAVTVGENSIAVAASGVTRGGFVKYSQNFTLTIENKFEQQGRLIFTYTINTFETKGTLTFKNNGADIPLPTEKATRQTGSVECTVEAGKSVVIYGQSQSGANSGGNVSITLSNITFVPYKESVEVTLAPSATEAGGSYFTVTGANKTVVDGKITTETVVPKATVSTQQIFTHPSTLEYTLKAEPAKGYDFIGWKDATTGKFITMVNPWVTQFDENISLLPVFDVAGTTYYEVNDSGIWEPGWNEAIAKAQEVGGAKKVTLVHSGTLSAGTYEIPSGVTMLIPFNAEHEFGTDFPVVQHSSQSVAAAKSTTYMALTMNQEAKIVVHGGGILNVAARINTNAGQTVGPWGQINMASGSSITVENEGTLASYGFITGVKGKGQGTVLAQSGSTIHESFQITDYRGGTASSGAVNNGVFPFSQYYIQNIEVPLTYEAGATEYVHTSAYLTKLEKGSATLVGNGGLFQLGQGTTLTKSYDGTTDRLNMEVDGDLTVDHVEVYLGTNINSAKYVLPITNNMSVAVNSGTTSFKNKIALLPGVEITVAEGAELCVNSELFVYDRDQWVVADQMDWSKSAGTVKINGVNKTVYGTTVPGQGYVNQSGNSFVAVANAPGRVNRRTTRPSNATIAAQAESFAAGAGTGPIDPEYFATFEPQIVDAKIDVQGTLTVNGALYTTESGANITSSKSGRAVVNNVGASETTRQVTQSGTTTTKVDITVFPAKLKNNDATTPYVQTAAKKTYNYNQNDSMWHVYSTWTDEKPHTCTEEGNLKYCTCELCVDSEGQPTKYFGENYEVLTAEEIKDPAAHNWGENGEGHVAAKAATCTEAGNLEYWHCAVCDGYFKDEKGEAEFTAEDPWAISATGHKYSEPVWGWAQDEETKEWTAAAAFTCINEGCKDESTSKAHVETANASVSSEQNKAPTCTGAGEMTYTAKVTVDHKEYTDTHAVKIAALGHDFTVFQSWGEWVAAEGGYTRNVVVKCSRCDATETQAATVTGPVVVPSTCKDYGTKTYTSTWGEGENQKTDTKVDTIEELAEHSWDDGTVTTPATCTEKGVKTFTCKVEGCTATKTEEIDVNPNNHVWKETWSKNESYHWYECSLCNAKDQHDTHKWDEGNVTTEPTCTEKGVKTYTCSVCQATKTENVDALGHEYGDPTWEWTEAGESYTAAATFTCKRGGCTDTTDGHTKTVSAEEVTSSQTKAPTCTEEGEMTYTAKVTVDHKEYTNTHAVKINVLGHDLTKTEAKDATCTEAGNHEYWTCQRDGCKKVFSDSEGKTVTTVEKMTIEALGHKLTKTEAKAATCTEKGNKAYWTCSTCEKLFGDAKGETETSAEAVMIDIDPDNHANVVTDEAVAATCYATGLTEGSHCEACGKTLTAQATTDKIAHTYGAPVFTWTKAESSWTAKATFTCTAAGCTDAAEGHSVTKDAVVSVKERVEATHTVDGKVVYQAAVDGYTAAETQTEVLKAEGHKLTAVAAKAPTCTKPGNLAYWTCTGCEDFFKDAQGSEAYENHDAVVLKETGHEFDYENPVWSWTESGEGYTATAAFACKHSGCEEKDVKTAEVSEPVVVPATCVEKGSKTYTATVTVGEGVKKTDTKTVEIAVDPNAHDWGEWTEVKVEGVSKHVRICKHNAEHSETAEHSFGEWVTDQEATCGAAGSKHRVCKDCGYREDGVIEATGNHNYSETWSQDDAGHWHECTVCGAKTDEAAHEIEIDAAVAATCQKTGLTEGKHCSVCKKVLVAQEETAVDPAAHTWAGEFAVDTPATCGAAGSKSKHCVNEGCAEKTEVTEIPATGEHTWGDWTNKTPATCTEDRVETRECGVCSATEDRTVEKTAQGHDFTVFQSWGEWVAVDGGYTCQAVVKCSRCDATENQAATVTGPVVVPSTCKDQGSKTYTSTWGEGENQKTDTKVDAITELAAHQYEEKVTAPTCTEGGYTTHTCKVCGDSYTDSKVDSLGHKWGEWKADRNADTHTRTCETCQEKETKDHAWNDGEQTKAPDCEHEGEKTYTCADCGATKTAPIEANGHKAGDPVQENREEATCAKEGSYDEVVYCTVCNKELSRTPKTIDKLAHTPGEPKKEITKDATCTEEGKYDLVTVCTECGEETSRVKDQIIEKLPHELEKVEAQAATCTEDGNIEYWTCTVCHGLFSDGEGKNPTGQEDTVIGKTGHAWGDWHETTAPTCTEQGEEERICGNDASHKETHPVNAKGHSYGEWIKEVPATCEDTGTKGHYTCADCGKNFDKDKNILNSLTIAKLDHYWSEWTTDYDPTCAEEGRESRTCLREKCEEVQTRKTSAKGHDYTGVTPSWSWEGDEENGYTATASFPCKNCDHVEEKDGNVKKETTDASCTQDGATAWVATVTFEGNTYTDHKDGVTISASGHAYGEPSWTWNDDHTAVVTFVCTKCDDEQTPEVTVTSETVKATCTEDGSITYTATTEFNGHTYSDPKFVPLESPGHDWENKEGKAATCEEDGYTAYQECSACHEIKGKTTLEKTGHDWDEGKVTTQPGCETTGVKTFTCQNDDSHTKTETVDATGHQWAEQVGKDATCSEDGYTSYQECSVCHKTEGKETIGKLGHSYGAPVFSWSQNEAGGWSAQAVFTCSREGCQETTEGHSKTVNAQVSVDSAQEVDATCEEVGSRTFTATAAFEGEDYTDSKTVELPELGHVEVTDLAKPATCTESGLTEGKHCSRCGKVLVEQETVPATGHTFEQVNWIWAEDNATATVTATCKTCGSVVEVQSQTAKDETRHVDATYDAEGQDVYVVKAVVEVDGKSYEFQSEKIVTLPKRTRPSGGGGGGIVEPDPEPVTPPEELTDPDTPLVETPFFFEDVEENDWFYDVVKSAVERGIMKGVSDTIFSPMGVTTRGSIITMIHRMETEPDGLSTFPDVVPTEWYGKAVAWGADYKIVKGYGDGTFGPDDPITREQMAAILYRYASFKGYDVSASAELDTFTDGGEVNSWAEEAVRWAVGIGLIQGKDGNRLDPLGTASRSEAAAMMARFYELVVKQ